MTANDVRIRKTEKTLIFDWKCNPKSQLTKTTLAGLSIKHGVMGGYILEKKTTKMHRNLSTKLYKQQVVPPSELMRTIVLKIFD